MRSMRSMRSMRQVDSTDMDFGNDLRLDSGSAKVERRAECEISISASAADQFGT